MKYLLITILSITSVLIGYSFKSRSHKRVRQLEDIILVINKIKTQLTYRNASVEEILIIISNEKSLTFGFIKSVMNQYKGIPFDELWKQEILKYKSKLNINNEEINLLIDFGCSLGTTDLKGQIGICEMYRVMFEERLNMAKEIKNKYSQTYSKLGYIGAAVIVTLLL